MGKNVIISGGSRGLGKALSGRIYEMGYGVSTFSRTMVDSQVEEDGKKYITTRADIRYENDIVRVLDRTKSIAGGADILILSAGVAARKQDILRSSVITMRKVYETNVFANFNLMSEAIRYFGLKMVVFITSDVSFNNYPGWGVYGSSKAALDYIIKQASMETVSPVFLSINPGDMDTEMHSEADPESDASDLISADEGARRVISAIMQEMEI
ncbi:MAG: SDR family NAD(P)-dependent oxidoreductase [Ferroplasma sp.]|uniref:SDR family NAD(P)-dependent oxidoreductase n=1 Tax=Ferroplasma sp. TaxID=2591003 RepID=UPI002814E26E|nr:SDR family NAD(P)-dependent oxidoreductase [Ferroplasma sp.]WMT50812.1 MAG: SDR family NAD(P)-dependent oxidoreductase [Ferroplasma sp.]